MEIITFVMTDEAITEVNCLVVGARLAYLAPGLSIYVEGSSKYHHPDCLNNLANNACLARHIPLISLRQQSGVSARRAFETNTKSMF